MFSQSTRTERKRSYDTGSVGPADKEGAVPKRIVIIAVLEPLGEIMAIILHGAGYECSLFCTHEAIPEALKQAANCDLVVCQVAALETEGEFLKWALGAGKDVPIVATAGRTPGYIPTVILERCSFLQGPFEKVQLPSAVRDAIENHAGRSLR